MNLGMFENLWGRTQMKFDMGTKLHLVHEVTPEKGLDLPSMFNRKQLSVPGAGWADGSYCHGVALGTDPL